MTITHEIEREEVMAYLDGELPPSRALAVRAHLDQCADCGALADDLRQVSSGLGEWDVEPAPERLVAPASAPARVARPHSPWFRWPIAAAAGMAAVAVFVTWTALGRRSAEPAVVGGAADKNSALPTVTPADSAFRSSDSRSEATRALGYAGGRQGQTQSFGAQAARPAPAETAAQMIVRTSSISLSTEKFDDMRAALERVASERHGSVAALTVAGDPPNRRSLSATLRVPIAEMDAALAGVRALGKVLQESQSSEDVTDAHRDLAIRIANAKVEETRLGEILKDRTGRLSDVLAVEQAQSRVRTEIEQMDAQELAMRNRAALSTISVVVEERYRAELGDTESLSIGARLRNAVVDGARTALESLVGVTLALLAAAPTLLLWAAMLFLPARWLIRRMRRVRPFSAQ